MSHVLGLDFGSEEIKICSMSIKRIIIEKNAIASDEDESWFGDEAYQMADRVSDRYRITFPVRRGMLCSYQEAVDLLRFYLEEFYHASRDSMLNLSLPTGLSHVQRKAYYELFDNLGIAHKNIRITDKPLAAAVGMGIPLLKSHGLFLLDMGAQTTELSIISDGRILISRLLPYGSDDKLQEIQKLVKSEKNCIIGRESAFQILSRIGHAYKVHERDRDEKILMTGINAVSGYPERFKLKSEPVTDVIFRIPEKIVAEAKILFERIPYDIRREINEKGIYLTGGASQLDRMDDFLTSRLALPCIKNDSPLENTARGLARMLTDDRLSELTYELNGID